ncbi:hypothetical protein T459_14244 [Capsicum annuum]|uniref:beta-ketoacyl-[acyl-carrier-protein] synthase I n=1 Tax=Capsicum annuum TaxID=4072 RepID=A0A2G2ZGU9_CAPAN|nr:hypothetical protein FXO37_15902 [Capsicum annuum]PHT81229.1 hypothetical protein T459_14244 [Capsicum annuum]
MGPALLAINTGPMGPNYLISLACASSNHSFCSAANHIRSGDADIMVESRMEAVDNGTTITLLIKQPLQAGGEALAGGEAAATAEAASGEASYAGVVAAGGEAAADSDHENLFIEDNDEFKNDVHEEDINLRAKRRKYQRQKRRERKSNDPKEVSVGEVGLDLGFEETEIADKSLKGKVDGDEPVYCSSDEYSVDSDLEDGLGKIDSRKVVYDNSAKQVMWQLGMVFEDVNEFRDVVTKYALQRGVKLEKYINESKKGLRATLIEFLPEVEYRICARHILANWGKNREVFKEGASSKNVQKTPFEAEMKKNLNQLAMLGAKDIVPEDSVGSSILNAGPSDVPSTSRPRGRQRNTPPPPTVDAPPRPRERPIKISDNPDAPPRPRGRPRKTTLVAPAGQATPDANIEYV